jgi:hypothetical protein
MRHALVVGLVGAGVVAAPQIARAEAWYYSWSCTGECAPGQLAISGEEGPFESYDECDHVRSQDSRAEYFVAPGNLGGLDFCTNREGQHGYRPAPGGGAGGYTGVGDGGGARKPAPVARIELGGLFGPAYRVETPAGYEDGSGATVGADVRMQTGYRPELGGEVVFGVQYSSVTTPHYGADARSMTFIPWMIGLTSTPALFRGTRREYRLDLGLDLGGLSRVGCSACAAEMLPTHAFIVAARGGLDTYFGAGLNQGIGVDAVFQWSHHGTVDAGNPASFAIVPPVFLLRVSLIVRSRDNVSW